LASKNIELTGPCPNKKWHRWLDIRNNILVGIKITRRLVIDIS
jgi:hypothetical protein